MSHIFVRKVVSGKTTFAGRQWWYEFRTINKIMSEKAVSKYCQSLSQSFSKIAKQWDDYRNSEWIVRIYFSAKMVLSASVMLESLEYAVRKNLRIVIPNLEYYAILSALRSVIFASPYLEWNHGKLIKKSHRRTINVVCDWLNKLDKNLASRFKNHIFYIKALRELISYRAPSSGGAFKKDTEIDIIETCQLFVELAQLQSELLENTIHKHVEGSYEFKGDYIVQGCRSKIDGYSFYDQEDAYRLDYLRRKYPLPTNVQHIMSEGHVEDFFGTWCSDEEDSEDLFDPDDNWRIIFDVP